MGHPLHTSPAIGFSCWCEKYCQLFPQGHTIRFGSVKDVVFAGLTQRSKV